VMEARNPPRNISEGSASENDEQQRERVGVLQRRCPPPSNSPAAGDRITFEAGVLSIPE
jgi:hypothetical protein